MIDDDVDCFIWIAQTAVAIMFAISVRWAVKNADSSVVSNDETIFKRCWLLNSDWSVKSDMMRNSFEVVNCFEFLVKISIVKISLDNDVDDVDVKDDKISWSRVRRIRFVKSNDMINEDSTVRNDSVRSGFLPLRIRPTSVWFLADVMRFQFDSIPAFSDSNPKMNDQ
jgi:hypothetical protein